MNNKNEAKLKSFIAHCKANPSERFWQALRNWSGADFIFKFDGALPESYIGLENLHDTFYDE